MIKQSRAVKGFALRDPAVSGGQTLNNNVILCVLNRMFAANVDGQLSIPDELSYSSFLQKQSFPGIQVNEAPVKYLIKGAHVRGKDINQIVYLCSNECYKSSIPASAIKHLAAFEDFGNDAISAEEFFIRRIEEFCSEQGLDVPAFNPLQYTPSRPADSLLALNEYLDDADEISIDMTGGRFDAVMLLLLAIRIITMKGEQKTVGEVAYASFDDKKITSQTATVDLIELVNSIESFTNYGRADKLCAYFQNKQDVSAETRNLCSRMQTFADALALCQVQSIDNEVSSIHEAMRKVDDALKERERCFGILTDAIDALDSPKGWNTMLSSDEALQVVLHDELIDETAGKSNECLREQLEDARLKHTVIRSELLLHGLIPTMREQFVPEAENHGQLIVNIIEWCASHQMLQQALCIYREKISEALISFGFFKPTNNFNNLNQKKRHEVVVNLTSHCQIGYDDNGKCQTICLKRNSKEDLPYDKYFIIDKNKSTQLYDVVAWYTYLRYIRNMISHVDLAPDTAYWRFACSYLEKQPTGEISLQDLKVDIELALKRIAETRMADQNSSILVIDDPTRTVRF